MENVPDMVDYIAKIVESFAPRVVFETILASEEILVNIVSYAYPNGDGQLAIAWEDDVDHHKFKLKFEDAGIPFNPLRYKEHNVSSSLEEMKIGGLGILIICKLSNEIQYTYVDGKNRLIITKEY